MVPLTFTQHSPPYAGGETAWFRPEKAASLVASGIARYADKPAAPPTDIASAQVAPTRKQEALPSDWRDETPYRKLAIAKKHGAPKDLALKDAEAFLENLGKTKG